MKTILLFLLSVSLLVSCKKDNAAPASRITSNCSIDINLVKDIQWHHVDGTLADLTFDSNGTYFENTTNDGNWSLSNGCDSIYVTRPANNFYYKVVSVTADTLRLENPIFGTMVYFN